MPFALSKFIAKRGHFYQTSSLYLTLGLQKSFPLRELVGVANVLETRGAIKVFSASKNLSRTKSLPSSSQNSRTLSSKPRSSSLSREWIRVEVVLLLNRVSFKSSTSTQTQVVPLTTEQLIEEEELDQIIEAIISRV
ncbi:hypothetical protein Bca4012_036162 [Brassica carinata]